MTDVHIGVLLPARLETRFVELDGVDEQGQPTKIWRLKIAVIPDEPWMNRHSDIVSPAEAERVEALWQACQNDPATLRTTSEGRDAFRQLAQEVGAARAWWLVTQFGPGDHIETGKKRLSRMDALPDQIEIWLGVRQGDEISLQRLEPPMVVNKAALTFDAGDGAAFSLFTDGRWWTRDAGLQAEYTLPLRDEDQLRQIELIMAIGLGEGSPRQLFEGHRNAGLLSLLPLGAATNTVSGEPAADLAQDPDTWWRLLSSQGEAITRDDLAQALAGDAAALAAIPGGTRGHRPLNQDLLSLLWPSLWGHTLKDVWGVDRALDARNFSFELGLWARDQVHPEGPLAPVRIGEQPYGVWPVTRLSNGAWRGAAGDPPVERSWLAEWLPQARRRWAAGAAGNSGTVVGADTDAFVRLLGRVPSGSDYGYRTFLPLQMAYLLSHSAFGPGRVKDLNTWRDLVLEQTRFASGDLNFPVRPIRRYMTSGWRQDLQLPLVEPEPMTDTEVQAVKDGGSAFFAQVERLFEIDRDGHGIARLFLANVDLCDALLQTDSLLMRLILNSIALLHAELGRMRETRNFDGPPLVERFDPNGPCTDLQMWCGVASRLSFDLLLDDSAVCDFFGLGLDCLDQVGQWPIVRLYRNLIGTLQSWLEAYVAALTRVRNGEPEAVRQLLADIERAFRATLDTAAVRVDPWITGMAWRRLRQMRSQGRGDGLGLYAWVDRPFTGTPGPTAGGTLLAPSHAQLLTSLILRDKQINDPQADRWQIALDSQQVRLARRFADEVRAGAHIQEVLGRAVEGIIGDKNQTRQLRDRFPIRKEHAGRRICDGQAVLATDEGRAFLNGLGLSPDQQAALDELRQVTDTYGDLLVANAVHAIVSGRPEKAGEIMDAAAGLELPPEFDVLRTPRAGNSVNTTVWMALPAVAQPPDPLDPHVSPAWLADASVAAFLEQAVPAGQWRWRVKRKGGNRTVTLADLGLSVAETLAYSEDALRQLAIRHVNGTSIIEGMAGGAPSSPAVQAHRRLRRLSALLAGHLRDVHNVRDDDDAGRWAQHDAGLRARLAALLDAAQALAVALASDLAGADELRRARRWGIAPAPLDDALAPQEFRLTAADQLKRQLQGAHETLQDRIERARALGVAAPVTQVVQALSELSGNGLPIYGRATRPMLEASGALTLNPALDRDWLETVAAVRPALARVEAHQLGPEARLHAWCNHLDPWTFLRDEAAVKRPMNVVICYSPSAALADDLAVAVLDSWSEMVPNKRHIVEAAVGFNAPSSRAPQAILLAVPPDESKPLDTDTLAHIVLDARESAHARMATPDDIGPYAALFPFAMIPARQPTGVSM